MLKDQTKNDKSFCDNSYIINNAAGGPYHYNNDSFLLSPHSFTEIKLEDPLAPV